MNNENLIEKYIIFTNEEDANFDINRSALRIQIIAKNDPDCELAYDTHNSLAKKLPGMCIEKEEMYLKNHFYQSFSFLKEDSILYCFKLETDNCEPNDLSINNFTDLKEFYFYVFNENLNIPIELCGFLKIDSPKDVFLNYIKNKNIYLLGYNTSMDTDGYDTMNLWLLKKHDDSNWSWFEFQFNAIDYRPHNKYFGVDGWHNIMEQIIDDTLFDEVTEKKETFNLILEHLTDQKLTNFHKNELKPYNDLDKKNISFLNAALLGSDFNDNW